MTTDLQKASLSKRIAAGILDTMLLCVLAVGFMSILFNLLNYSDHREDLNRSYEYYETQYGVSFDLTQEDFDAMTEAEKEKLDAAYQALINDDDAMYTYNLLINLTLLITTFGILLATIVLEFVVPLWLKNGQTVGKKVFSLGVMRIDGVQITPVQLFVRTILGKFTVETMIPVYIIIMMFFNSVGIFGTGVLLILLVGQAVSMIVTRTNSMLHDLIGGTVAVDIASQKIFRNTDDLIDYQKKIAAERAARQDY
jgi:uncharacterized RDD family membrane protein YckC